MENAQMKAIGEENKETSPAPLIILAAMGLLIIYLIGQKTQISCSRPSAREVNCLINSVWMGTITVSSREASGVENAYVDSDYDDEDDSTTYRVVLRTKNGDVPVSRAYSSGNIKKNELANDINSFIKSPTQSDQEFSYKSAGGIISAIVVAVFFVVYAWIVFKSKRG